MTDQSINSVLHENRLFPPPAKFVEQARITKEVFEQLHQQAEQDYEGFWANLAQSEIDWQTPFSITLDESKAPHYRWFSDGKLNISYNCIDRHLESRGEKTAIIFEGEQGDIRHLSYRDLHAQVCRFANGLKALGIEKGDRVVIYMPMTPEAVIAMQACARIGAIHSVVFGGFSAESLKDRIEDAGAKMLITADGGHRGGKIVELKAAADKALESGCASIDNVIVFQRTQHDITIETGRDIWWHDAIADQPSECEPEWVDAEHPLFLLYTSGSTGKPKGIQHATGGYLLGAITTMKWVFDVRDDDVYWCTADVGWITGHTYVAYGPLAVGATQVIYEGAPTIPDTGRFWSLCERHRVSTFYTAPTAIRALMKYGDEVPARYDLSSIRLLG
ncbi:MAG TPA: acetyl-coenzyme A synthetase, partial [Candidatus Tenderia sp.]|nr:acetyl-coenzyme A synthetase [Candidatus Tenderia sp.]